jgi:crossover junction endodeoxyribonuclease RuvC
MKVLGIDPGTAALGYGIVERTGGRLREVDHGCLRTSADLSLPERLLAIHALVDELIALHEPDLMGVERLFFSRNVQTALGVGQARGVVLLAAAQHGTPVREATPNEARARRRVRARTRIRSADGHGDPALRRCRRPTTLRMPWAPRSAWPTRERPGDRSTGRR